VTGLASDRYAFRTPALRNVELTAPYGHNGAFFSLREFVDHYSVSHLKLETFNTAQLEDLLRFTLLDNTEDILATRDPLLEGVFFPPQVVDEVTEFMLALTDPAARNLQAVVPGRVPSGLDIEGGIGRR
jgi:cytochrome c peroxidase